MASHTRTMSGVMGASLSCSSSLAHSAPGFVVPPRKSPSALGARAIPSVEGRWAKEPTVPIEFVTSSLVILLGRIRQ